MLCFPVLLNSVFPVTLTHTGPPYMGMQARVNSALQAPSPALLRHRCALLSASGITVSTFFERVPADLHNLNISGRSFFCFYVILYNFLFIYVEQSLYIIYPYIVYSPFYSIHALYNYNKLLISDVQLWCPVASERCV